MSCMLWMCKIMDSNNTRRGSYFHKSRQHPKPLTRGTGGLWAPESSVQLLGCKTQKCLAPPRNCQPVFLPAEVGNNPSLQLLGFPLTFPTAYGALIRETSEPVEKQLENTLWVNFHLLCDSFFSTESEEDRRDQRASFLDAPKVIWECLKIHMPN